MQFSAPLIPATLVERQNRFLAKVSLSDTKIDVWAHCPNPGSMRGNAVAGSTVWLQDYGAGHLNSGRKLRYRWVLVAQEKSAVCVDTSLANKIVAEALNAGSIPELKDYSEIQPEVKTGKSRLDFLLRSPRGEFFLEVKAVSMAEGKRALFPDSVTARGQKHLEELMDLQRRGKKAGIMFLVQRNDCTSMGPAWQIDRRYSELLKQAVEQGVKVLVYDIVSSPLGISLGKAVPFVLGAAI